MVAGVAYVAALLVGFGLAGAVTGWKRRGVHAALTDARATSVRDLDAPETVELSGTATPVRDAITAPVTGRDAVVAAWTVEEWDERGDRSYWREVARGIEAPALALDDGTGTVTVDAVSKRETAGKWTQTSGVTASDGVRIGDVLAEFQTFPVRRELGPDDDVPADIHRLHEEHGLYEDTGSPTNAVDVGTKHGARRYAEQVLPPGADGHVLGAARRRESTGERAAGVVVTEPDDGLLVLSDQAERSLEAEFEGSYRSRLYGGLAALAAGVVLLVAHYGPGWV